jgi:glucose/arabinose dehydrogenase/PKD repeat protein
VTAEVRRNSQRLLLALLALTSVVALRAATPAHGAPAGLVAAYSFDEGTGTTAADASGNGNSGAIGTATWTGSGKYSGALSFNGGNARVTVNDSASLDLTTEMTLEAWVFPTASSDWRDVVYKADDVYYLESSSPGGSPGTGGTFGASPLIGPSVLPTNVWSHLAATFDGGTLKLYVNGAQVAGRAQGGTIATSNLALTIGGDALYGQSFQGAIDEVRIYNVALTQAQIQADMTTPIGNQQPDPTPPTVSITSPTPGSTVSQVPTVSATASDNVGVASVQFFADGASLGTDLNPPYVVQWNTTGLANGSHTLTAVARDGGGNQTTSAAISVSTLNPGFVNEVVVPDVQDATTIAFLPDGRMLIGELSEKILVVQPGASQPDATPFLQLDSSQLIGEQGLMDILPDKNFAQNGFYYVFYTKGSGGQNNHNRVSRFTASGNGTVAGSELRLWEDDVVAAQEHHGGSLAWGADDKLYITYGDQFQSTPAQQLASYRGKVLRINKDGTVPTDNPFYDGNGSNKDQIWALGLRNPFRMSIDPVSGTMYIGDVGGNDASTAFEEVNVGARGANYGWPNCEGLCGLPGVTSPIHSYPHNGRDASITGGVVYRGTQFPNEYRGSYFFADYVQNTIKRLVFDGSGNVATVANFWPADGATDGPSVGDPVKFLQGPDGSLYYVDIGFNDQHVPNPAAIRRIRYIVGNQPPTAIASGNPTSGQAPLTVSFSSAGSSDPEGTALTYSWVFGDGGTSTQANPSHTYQAPGSYVARLTVSDGVNSTVSNSVPITVGSPPTATILTPTNGISFRAGDAIGYSGSASDPEDGTLPASAFTWTILFHHDSHVHPGGVVTGTKTGTLQIPASGHDFEGSTSYEIVLTVTDSTGLSSSTSVTVFPDKVNLTFNSVPNGLNIEIDGITKQTPFVLDDLKGFQHTINAPNQANGGTSYAFSSWSDGGGQSHSIVVPTTNQSYTATFTAVGSSNLVAAYSFDEGSGASTADASGNGNVGTIANATWATAGKFGKALSFNGTNARVNVASSASLQLTSGMTLEAWVNPAVVSNAWRDVVYKGDDNYFLEATSFTGSRPAGGGIIGGSGTQVYGAGALAVNAWAHLALTYDGSILRLYVNGSQASSTNKSGGLRTSTNQLQIGGDGIYGQYFQGLIDEVRVFNVARTQAQIQSDMNTPIGAPPPPPPPDTTPPSAPTGLVATPSIGRAALTWGASSDNVGVDHYNVHRSTTANFTPATANRVAQPTATSYTDTGLAGGTYYYRVTAADAAGNISGSSNEMSAVVPGDQPPSVSITAPVGGATVSGTITVTASASDDVGVAGVQFQVDGAALGAEDTSAPYSVPWLTNAVSNGSHRLTAVARDGGGHQTTSAPVDVTVDNAPAPPPSGLVAAYSFNTVNGSTVADLSGNNNTGTVSNAVASVAGKYGGALSFNGTNARVNVAGSASLQLTSGMTLEAWVNPAVVANDWTDVVYKGNDNYYLEASSFGNGGRPGAGGTFSTAPLYGPSALPVNTWSHLAVTYDRVTLRLYVNGVQVSSVGRSAAIATSTNPLQIGGDGIYGQYFQGLIDEVRVFNLARTQAQIQTDMNAPLTP